ncbi:aquaporin-9-like [Saccoglossus kowalevskii]|uniref:Aquaporin-9-like n=1 Tax=Saccoglossus kowalevskii TaxID=10224 RepID=A0ABM0MGE0_SACKO|nr:PREDICTED: aquaporin-9-like [Saccoglossus kowalevskii]
MSSLETWVDRIGPRLRIHSPLARQAVAEFLGTFVLISFGCSGTAQYILSDGENGNVLTANWGWGIGLCMGMYVAFGPSGAHFNPAVSVAFAIVGRFPWRSVPVYILVQFLASFVASIVVYGVYYDALNDFDGGVRVVIGPNATASIWATYPQEYLSVGNAIWDQLFATYIVILCVTAVIDERNIRPPPGMEPFIVGLLIFTLGNCLCYNAGGAINPTRDFAPRLFTYMVGYGNEVWTPYGWHFWWIPIVMPLIGATLGALTYIFLVEIHHPPLGTAEIGQDISIEQSKAMEAEKDKVKDPQTKEINANEQVNTDDGCVMNAAFIDDCGTTN